MTRVRVDDLVVSDEAGFACSKSKLVEEGLPHFRPFNIADDGGLDLTQVYLVPPGEAPKGKAQLLAGDILFNNTNSSDLVGKSVVVNGPMVAGFSNHLTRIRVDGNRIDPLWFGFWLRRLRSTGYFTANATQWVSQAAYRTADLRRLELDLPPLGEQRRIVDLLSRAQGIVRLRREAQAKAAEIIPALFLDMFGDPATNPIGWPTFPIESLCPVQTGATPRRDQPLYYEGGTIPWIKTGEVFESHILSAEEHITELAVKETNCKVFPTDTILVAMYGQGQTRGRAGMLKVPAATNQACAAILPGDKVHPTYLFELLKTQYGRLRAMGRGGNQANLNLGMVKSFIVPCPPPDVQALFVRSRAIIT